MDTLTEMEKDFVDFFAERNGEPRDTVLKAYEAAKKSIDLAGDEYRKFTIETYTLFAPYLNDRTEKSAIEAYRHFAFLDILRFVSYSFPEKRRQRYLRGMRRLMRGDLRPLKKLIFGRGEKQKTLLDFVNGPRNIVDYGSGGAYVSFELARIYPGTTVTLVDIDSVSLDFTLWRFRRYGIPVNELRVTPESVYPKLPPHDVCIANEVMEHLHQPLRAFQNIDASLKKGGILHGDFDDHGKELFHVSSDLSALRQRLKKSYEMLTPRIFRKL